MRISDSEGVRAPEPGKPVEKVASQPGGLSVHESGATAATRRRTNMRRGIVLRRGDKRRQPAAGQDGGRTRQRRSASALWNPETHDILVIALEKSPHLPQNLQEGETIFVDSLSNVHGAPAADSPGRPDEGDADYVLHLTFRR